MSDKQEDGQENDSGVAILISHTGELAIRLMGPDFIFQYAMPLVAFKDLAKTLPGVIEQAESFARRAEALAEDDDELPKMQ